MQGDAPLEGGSAFALMSQDAIHRVLSGHSCLGKLSMHLIEALLRHCTTSRAGASTHGGSPTYWHNLLMSSFLRVFACITVRDRRAARMVCLHWCKAGGQHAADVYHAQVTYWVSAML